MFVSPRCDTPSATPNQAGFGVGKPGSRAGQPKGLGVAHNAGVCESEFQAAAADFAAISILIRCRQTFETWVFVAFNVKVNSALQARLLGALGSNVFVKRENKALLLEHFKVVCLD